jgi:hypothetical protein
LAIVIGVRPRLWSIRAKSFLSCHAFSLRSWKLNSITVLSSARSRCQRLIGNKRYQAHKALICPGGELNSLYGDQLSGLGLTLCKLQMMRTAAQPDSWQLGPALADGLTLRFYPSFQICSSLDALRERISRETPELDRWGIHTMVSQGADGSLTFGDSHESAALNRLSCEVMLKNSFSATSAAILRSPV